MVETTTPVCQFNLDAIDFSLPDTDNNTWDLAKARGEKGLLVMFICNHCPFVKAILPELVEDCLALKELGVNTVAIMSNDVETYPDDSPAEMKKLAKQAGFSFPYLFDADQSVAKAYGAVCTPDFFGFNKELKLQYRGRFDTSGRNRVEPRGEKELFNAMKLVAETGRGPENQIPSIGCSIKWK